MIIYFIKSPYTHEFRWLAVDDEPSECLETHPGDYYDERDIDLVKKKLREHFSTKDFIVKYIGKPREWEPNQFTITFFNNENNDFFRVLSSDGLEI